MDCWWLWTGCWGLEVDHTWYWLTPTSDTPGPYPKEEPSRQALNSAAETNSSLLSHYFCYILSFLLPFNYFYFSSILVALFLISLILILDCLTSFFLPLSLFCYSFLFFVPFFCFPHLLLLILVLFLSSSQNHFSFLWSYSFFLIFFFSSPSAILLIFSLLLLFAPLCWFCCCWGHCLFWFWFWCYFALFCSFVQSAPVQGCTRYGWGLASQSASWRGDSTNEWTNNNEDPSTRGEHT